MGGEDLRLRRPGARGHRGASLLEVVAHRRASRSSRARSSAGVPPGPSSTGGSRGRSGRAGPIAIPPRRPRRAAVSPCPGAKGFRRPERRGLRGSGGGRSILVCIAGVFGCERVDRGKRVGGAAAACPHDDLVALAHGERRKAGQAAPGIGRTASAALVDDLDARLDPGESAHEPSGRAGVEAEPVIHAQAQLLRSVIVACHALRRVLGLVAAQLRGLHGERAARLARHLVERPAAACAGGRRYGALHQRSLRQQDRATLGIGHLGRHLRAHQRAAEVHQHEHTVGRSDRFDGLVHARGVGAERPVLDPAGRLDRHLAGAHLAGPAPPRPRPAPRCGRRSRGRPRRP